VKKKIAHTGKKRDVNQIAAAILQAATTDTPEEPEVIDPTKNSHAVALGRLGGRKGGLARAKKLTAKRRSEIARKGAKALWKKRQLKSVSND